MAERDTRRLSAIMAVDIVGYSRLMEADEADTLKRLRALRSEVIDPRVAEYGGRIVKTTGDGLLVENGSAVDAVQCAVDIQSAMAEIDLDRSEGDRMRMRIGVNLGDVIIDGDDIFGDGVNVAARLESLADTGGLSVSQSVFDLLKGALADQFEDAGEQSVKNIKRPIRVWRWSGGSAARPVKPMLTGRAPAFAILPFSQAGDDPDLRDLGDGVVDDITTIFASRSGIEIIGRSLTAEAATLPNPIARLRRDHGADYILTGVLRRGGERARLSAELVETNSGRQVWANRFEQDLADPFAAQDALTERLAMAVRTAMNANEGRQLIDLPDDRLTDAQRRAKAAQSFYRFSADGFAAAAHQLDVILQHNPNDAMALSMQAFRIAFNVYLGISPAGKEEARRAVAMARRGVQLANTNDYAYAVRGLVALHVSADPDAAVDDARHCLKLQPQYAIGLALLGEATAYAGRSEEGIPFIRKPIEADPRDPTNFLRYWMLAMAYFGGADYAAALEAIERGLRGLSGMPVMHLAHAAILARLDRMDEARAVIDRLRKRYPKATLANIHQPLYKKPEDRTRFIEALAAAGLRKK